MNEAIWDDLDNVWVIEFEANGKPFVLSLSANEAKALYYALEEVWPEIDEQCASS